MVRVGQAMKVAGVASKGIKAARKVLAAAPDQVARPTVERAARGTVVCVTETLAGDNPGEKLARRGFRVSAPIDTYAKRNLITADQAMVGRAFAESASLAALDAAAVRLMSGGSGVAAFPADGMTVRRLDAIRRLAKVRAVVGRSGFEILMFVCHHGEDAGDWQGAMGKDRRERSRAAMIVLRRALQDLIDDSC